MREPVFVAPGELALARAAALRLKDALNGAVRRYYIESYGCQMNDHDSEKLAGMLREIGYTQAESKADADLILFNTCCVREHAEKRVFGNIGALKKQKDANPALLIAVCGCMMQQKEVSAKLYKRFPFVDMVFGTNELHKFPLLLEEALRGNRVLAITDSEGEIAEGLPIARSGAFSTNVTIMYGCNNYCTYCIVPYVRGRERSRNSSSIVEEVRLLAEAGYKEITLLGQNVNSYCGDGGAVDFPALLRRVHGVEGIERIRFMTSHPKDLSPGLIEAMAALPRVCNHIHLPVQSGSDRVLAAMNRKYTRASYLACVQALRGKVPGLELTTDVIVGFPGETEEDFADTLTLVEQAGYSAAYTFMYSPRAGTQAATLPDQVPEDVKKQRLQRLNTAMAAILQRNNPKYVGQSGEVLVEGCDMRTTPMAYGKLTNFKMVYFPGGEEWIGTLQRVKIIGVQNNSLIGERIDR
ncbi:MAG: tRNA (N6-isopentenyl adenosine(37)-C2)-methylthiotransferase MiaB [Christensenellaceae bacterium]|jgi:tRNA-2-methylthio-N6-dimethylallyladenosine synthase|nr:tRNA (N6-isopentenyl adenosine(37)-C2)-methylthiotransferase MiaB [Christensenellaceae bacterium]